MRRTRVRQSRHTRTRRSDCLNKFDVGIRHACSFCVGVRNRPTVQAQSVRILFRSTRDCVACTPHRRSHTPVASVRWRVKLAPCDGTELFPAVRAWDIPGQASRGGRRHVNSHSEHRIVEALAYSRVPLSAETSVNAIQHVMRGCGTSAHANTEWYLA